MIRIKPREKDRGLIHYSEIYAAYRNQFKISFFQEPIPGFFIGNIFRFADTYYQETNLNTMGEVLRADLTDREKWIRQFRDCDDFTFSLMGAFHHNGITAGMPIFITWVLVLPEDVAASRWRRALYWFKVVIGAQEPQGHALLSYYINGDVKLIEPQTDQVYNVPDNYRLLLLCG